MVECIWIYKIPANYNLLGNALRQVNFLSQQWMDGLLVSMFQKINLRAVSCRKRWPPPTSSRQPNLDAIHLPNKLVYNRTI